MLLHLFYFVVWLYWFLLRVQKNSKSIWNCFAKPGFGKRKGKGINSFPLSLISACWPSGRAPEGHSPAQPQVGLFPQLGPIRLFGPWLFRSLGGPFRPHSNRPAPLSSLLSPTGGPRGATSFCLKSGSTRTLQSPPDPRCAGSSAPEGPNKTRVPGAVLP
jgi:hypothetical protein